MNTINKVFYVLGLCHQPQIHHLIFVIHRFLQVKEITKVTFHPIGSQLSTICITSVSQSVILCVTVCHNKQSTLIYNNNNNNNISELLSPSHFPAY